MKLYSKRLIQSKQRSPTRALLFFFAKNARPIVTKRHKEDFVMTDFGVYVAMFALGYCLGGNGVMVNGGNVMLWIVGVIAVDHILLEAIRMLRLDRKLNMLLRKFRKERDKMIKKEKVIGFRVD